MTPECIDFYIKLISFLCLLSRNILIVLMNIHEVHGTAVITKPVGICHLHFEGNISKNYRYIQPSILFLKKGR